MEARRVNAYVFEVHGPRPEGRQNAGKFFWQLMLVGSSTPVKRRGWFDSAKEAEEDAREERGRIASARVVRVKDRP